MIPPHAMQERDREASFKLAREASDADVVYYMSKFGPGDMVVVTKNDDGTNDLTAGSPEVMRVCPFA